MGVSATYCQICHLPVQHDHYVPMKHPLGEDVDDLWAIYRGDPHSNSAFPFGRDHAWLKEAVALRVDPAAQPQVVEGEVHDGALELPGGGFCFVGDGYMGWDGRVPYHKACWEIAGKPEWSGLQGLLDDGLFPYGKQLFDFVALEKDGRGWMLVDPRLDTAEGRRSRERIQQLLSRPRQV